MCILVKNTDQTPALISQSLKLSHVFLITSRPMHQNTKPKGTIVKAKFIQTNNYEQWLYDQPDKDVQ